MNPVPVRVLLVEDSPSDAQLLREYLSLAAVERFEVTHVERLEEALSCLNAGRFDVVLLDLSLPDTSGHNTFLRMQAAAPHVPIVVLSGTSDELIGIEAVRHGIQDYLVKGQADDRQIARAIRYALERSRAEEALTRQKRMLDALMGAASDHYYMWDREKRYIFINAAALRFLEKTGEDVLGRTWRELGLPAEVMEPFEAEVERVFAAGRHCRGELNFPQTDRPHHFEYIINPVFASGGQVESVAISNRDNTARKHMEEALRDGEERFRLASDAGHALVYDVDQISGRAISIHGLHALLGHEPDGKPLQTKDWWFSQVHPDDRPDVEEKLKDAFAAANDYSLQYRLVNKHGRTSIVQDSGQVIRDARGRVVRTVGSMVDITERKLAEMALRESEERYRQLADKLERMVEERTADLRRLNRTLNMITDCNEAIVRARGEEELLADICRIAVDVGGYRMAWVGYAQEDAAKTVLPVAFAGFENDYLSRVHISWTDDESGRGPTGTAVRTGKPYIGRDFRNDPSLAPWRAEALRCGFGSSIALPLTRGEKTFGSLAIYASEPEAFGEKQIQVLQELADDLAFGIVALRTRAERDRASEALQRRTAQLRTLASELTHAEERERRRLAQAIHDNLQQLLVGAKLSNDTLRKRCQTGAQLEVIEHLSEFLKESLDAARSLTFELSPPVLYDVGLAAALEWLGRWMQAKHGLTVLVHADRVAEPENEDVRILLFRATRELLFNVVKHAQINTAEVQLSRSGRDRVRIVVCDKGVGFVPKRSGAGELQSGFGLFSIRERLDLFGGQMEIESKPGHGSRFVLFAPLRSAPAASPAAAQTVRRRHRRKTSRAQVPAPIGPKIRVLLVDDHTLMRQGLVRLLREQRDLEVVGEAGDGLEALELVRKTKPDVVLMDVHMPRMNGIEATARLKEEFPAVKVVALSMWDEPDWINAMSKAGAQAYLNKAGPLNDVINAIRGCASPSK